MPEDEIIASILENREESIIHSYLKLRKKPRRNICSEIQSIDNISDEIKETVINLLKDYLEETIIADSEELEFYYKTGFKDGAKIMLEIFKERIIGGDIEDF